MLGVPLTFISNSFRRARITTVVDAFVHHYCVCPTMIRHQSTGFTYIDRVYELRSFDVIVLQIFKALAADSFGSLNLCTRPIVDDMVFVFILNTASTICWLEIARSRSPVLRELWDRGM